MEKNTTPAKDTNEFDNWVIVNEDNVVKESFRCKNTAEYFLSKLKKIYIGEKLRIADNR